nr:OmpA family protein [Oceanococcus sp. HetDA_MAG_MS8]
MRRLITLMGLWATVMSVPLWAQDEQRDQRFYIGAQAQYWIVDEDRRLDDATGYSLSLGKILGRGSNLEFSADFVRTSPDADAESDTLLQSLGLGLVMFPSRDTLPWYVLARYARGNTRVNEDSANEEEFESDQFDLGLGYLLGLGNWPVFGNGPALRFEARYRFDKYRESEARGYSAAIGIDEQRSFHDYLIGVGIQVPIGPDPNARKPLEEREASEVVVVPVSDSDGDQIPDNQDQCPNSPAGSRVDVNGCERDDDNDGVANSADSCPNTREGAPVDGRGCAPDADQDGILNTQDACPDTPRGAPVLADGCAIAGDCRTPQPGQAIDGRGCAAQDGLILKGVNFVVNSSDLTAAAQRQLDRVAGALAGSRGLSFEVAGHTDNSGDAQDNLKLSEARAIAVKNYLVDQGVSASMLRARGYGEQQPIASNQTARGREINRRVELRTQPVKR